MKWWCEINFKNCDMNCVCSFHYARKLLSMETTKKTKEIKKTENCTKNRERKREERKPAISHTRKITSLKFVFFSSRGRCQIQSKLAISNSVNSKSPLFRRKIECPWIYPSPLLFPGYFEVPLFRTFFQFPWDFEIAGFHCIIIKKETKTREREIWDDNT